MKRRNALKISSLGAIGVTTSINTSCSKNIFMFNHGVASGDPTDKKVILWTRVTPKKPGPVKISLEISEDIKFSKIVFSKELQTSSLTDYTIKYDFLAKKYCKSDNGFFYRFKAGKTYSDIGKSNTFSSKTKKLKIGIFSCSNYPAGFFNAYGAAASRKLDIWLHLGDYLYEYPMGGYATDNAEKLGRAPIPLHEMITLSDYRQRHAQYKQDLGSKELHKNVPLIAVWDDHEFTNDTWKRGAENHSIDGSEGDFFARRAAAIKAYYEWMPIREQKNKRKIFREFRVGDLLHLLMLDTRQFARDKQVQPLEYLSNSGFNQAKFYNDLNSENRNLLGPEQISWIKKAIQVTNTKWTFFGQQVLMTKLKFPDISNAFKEIPDELKPYIQLIKLGLPSNLDAWDGYPKERERLYSIMQQAGKRFISLAGDTHNSWLSELFNKAGKKIGIEIGAPSVTSPGLTDYIPVDPRTLEESIVKRNSEVFWMNAANRGFVSIEVNHKNIEVSYNFIKTIYEKNFSIEKFKKFKISENYEINV
tara:strand:+ start:6937 stop:8532 length:1596 start_codon:yes stop_codon:yes gene_type:complete